MSHDRSFWRNVTIIGAVHVAVIGGLLRWSSEARKSVKPDILWLDGGAASLVGSVATAVKPPEPQPAAEPERVRTTPAESDQPVLTEAKSEIQLPTPTPTPTPTPQPTPTAAPATAKPSPTPKSSASPRSKASPKPSPKATPKPSPSASPKKTLIARAEPSPSREIEEEKPAETPAATATAAPADAASQTATDEATKTAAAPGAARPGTGSGPGGASQVRSYSRMLHDRFYRAWEQPTSVVAAGTKMSALVKIRIEKDGRVSGFTIVRPSGNVLVDESVTAVGRRVTRVDPLPAGVGDSHYEVKMNFELTLSH